MTFDESQMFLAALGRYEVEHGRPGMNIFLGALLAKTKSIEAWNALDDAKRHFDARDFAEARDGGWGAA